MNVIIFIGDEIINENSIEMNIDWNVWRRRIKECMRIIPMLQIIKCGIEGGLDVHELDCRLLCLNSLGITLRINDCMRFILVSLWSDK